MGYGKIKSEERERERERSDRSISGRNDQHINPNLISIFRLKVDICKDDMTLTSLD